MIMRKVANLAAGDTCLITLENGELFMGVVTMWSRMLPADKHGKMAQVRFADSSNKLAVITMDLCLDDYIQVN